MVRHWSVADVAAYVPRNYHPLQAMYAAKGYDKFMAMYRAQYLAVDILRLSKSGQDKIIKHAEKKGWASALNRLEDMVIQRHKKFEMHALMDISEKVQ